MADTVVTDTPDTALVGEDGEEVGSETLRTDRARTLLLPVVVGGQRGRAPSPAMELLEDARGQTGRRT